MADYSMDDPKWSKNESRVLLYLENNDIGDMEAVIRWNLDQGREDVANRKSSGIILRIFSRCFRIPQFHAVGNQTYRKK